VVVLIRLFTAQRNGSMDGPNGYLKGIKIISFSTFLEKTIGGEGCNIDRENLNTSLQFVANQSTNLKFVPFSERLHKSSELYSQLNVTSLSSADKEAAKKVADDYNLMPSLFFEIMPLQTQFACAGTINVKLLGYIEEHAHMIPTRVAVYAPTVAIWSVMFGFVGPQQTFSNKTINITEQIMKQLVNDWAASQ
jgi:hypothetical protein